MPKLSEEFIRREFYRTFRAMSPERREGIIEALTVIHIAQGAPEVKGIATATADSQSSLSLVVPEADDTS